MRAGRRMVRGTLALVIVGGIITLGLRALPRRPPLLERAKKVTYINTITPMRGRPWISLWFEFTWISDHQIVTYGINDMEIRDLNTRKATPFNTYLQSVSSAEQERFLQSYSDQMERMNRDRVLQIAFRQMTTTPGMRSSVAQWMPEAVNLARRVPLGAQVVSVAHSPDDKHLAWLFKASRPSGWQIYLHRLIPAYKMRPRRVLLLCVSAADGGHMREIGSLPLDKDPTAPLPGMPRRFWQLPLWGANSIQWLPGGKRLSFTYKDTLYTIAID